MTIHKIQLIFFLFLAMTAHANRNIDYVDLFIATADDYGQNDPSATVPYGMVKVGADTDPKAHGGYNYESARLMGFSINRISGTGCTGAGGNLRILPSTDANSYIFLHKGTERATPGFYSVDLSNGVKVELTATNNMAVERYYFGTNSVLTLELDTRSSFALLNKSSYNKLSFSALNGEVQAQNVCNCGRYILYYHLSSSQPFDFTGGEKLKLQFKKEATDYVEIRIALSPIDEETANREYDRQATLSFDAVKRDAFMKWEEKLSFFNIKADEDDKRMFYTSLYRNFLSPVNVTSHNNSYRDSQGRERKAQGFTYYSSWSLWDTYRTKFPLLSLIDAKHYGDICRSLVELYRSGKVDWATQFESTPTARTEHAVIILLDALRKGIKGFDLNTIYDKLEEEAAALPMKSPDNFMESAYDLWALANISKELKKSERYKHYIFRADTTWRNKWVEKFKTIHPETFDIMHGDGLYEGTLWQYRWAIPFAIDEVAKLVGGKEKLTDELSHFFSNDLYNHGNQPDIQAAYLFNHLGRPDMTQQWVNRILTRPMTHHYGTHVKFKAPSVRKIYQPTPRGFIYEMDDDDATMSAWYVWSSIGLYPLVIGEPYYEIVNPLFEEVTMNLPDGKTFTIMNRALGSPNAKIKSVMLNGKEITNFRLNHADILKGGVLEIL